MTSYTHWNVLVDRLTDNWKTEYVCNFFAGSNSALIGVRPYDLRFLRTAYGLKRIYAWEEHRISAVLGSIE